MICADIKSGMTVDLFDRHHGGHFPAVVVKTVAFHTTAHPPGLRPYRRDRLHLTFRWVRDGSLTERKPWSDEPAASLIRVPKAGAA